MTIFVSAVCVFRAPAQMAVEQNSNTPFDYKTLGQPVACTRV